MIGTLLVLGFLAIILVIYWLTERPPPKCTMPRCSEWSEPDFTLCTDHLNSDRVREEFVIGNGKVTKIVDTPRASSQPSRVTKVVDYPEVNPAYDVFRKDTDPLPYVPPDVPADVPASDVSHHNYDHGSLDTAPSHSDHSSSSDFDFGGGHHHE